MFRLLAVAALVAGLACSGGSTGYSPPPPPPNPPAVPPPPPPPGVGHSTTITVDNNFFSPTPDTIPAGTITFEWAAGAIAHNVTWNAGGPSTPANSGNKTSGTYQALLVQGTYNYHCSIHSSMTGVIVVLP
jgi:plastocyanin